MKKNMEKWTDELLTDGNQDLVVIIRIIYKGKQYAAHIRTYQEMIADGDIDRICEQTNGLANSANRRIRKILPIEKIK